MNFFYMKVNVDDRTGNPQILTTSKKYDVHDKNGIYAFSLITDVEFPEVEEIKYLLLEKGSTISDVMNAEMLRLNGLLLNNKVAAIIKNYNLPRHKFYPMWIKDEEGNVYDYLWFHTGSDREKQDYLDYKSSEFYIQKDILGLNKQSVEINSSEDLERENEQLNSLKGQGVKISKAVLTNDFIDLKPDLFKIGRLSSDWIISEKLKDALESNRISGISIKKANLLTGSSL